MAQSLSTPLAVVLVGSLIAAVTDIWKFKVYNLLTLPLLFSGLIYHAVVDGAAGLSDSLLGVLLGFGSLLVLHVLGGVGAGDVKLMAAVGAWLGTELTFCVFLASSLAAGVYAAVLMVVSGRVAETLVNLQVLVHRLVNVGRYLGADDRLEIELRRDDRRSRFIPFGAMVAVGVIATLIYLKGR